MPKNAEAVNKLNTSGADGFFPSPLRPSPSEGRGDGGEGGLSVLSVIQCLHGWGDQGSIAG